MTRSERDGKTAGSIVVLGLSAGHRSESSVRRTLRLVAQDVSLEIPVGSISALVGGNGSGKSTILRAIVDPTFRLGGTVEQDGRALRAGEVAYMPQASASTLFPWQDGNESIRLWTDIHGRKAIVSPSELASRYGLTVPLSRKVTELSGGERVQIALLRALAVPDRKLLVLDEPFEGLARHTRDLVIHLLRSVSAEGTPILLTSHRVDDIDALDATVYSLSGTPVSTLRRLQRTKPGVSPGVPPAPEDSPSSPPFRDRTEGIGGFKIASVYGVVVGLVVWATVAWSVGLPTLVPGPLSVGRELRDIISEARIWSDLIATIGRATASWLLGLVVAIPVGTLLGYYRHLYSVASPWLSLGRTFPAFTLTGLAIGLFTGLPEVQRLFLITLTVFLIGIQIVASSAFAAPRRRVDLARIFGAGRWFCLRRIMVFEAMGGILAALETTLPLAFVLTLVIEVFLIPQRGIGRFVLNSLQGASSTTTIASVLLPAMLAALGVAGIRWQARRWRTEL